mmetsp:Transcript_4501/g.9064  ORF Transcript_4501/g.9064 Transcript_4501/m.9064 type:complete len:218 (-) Transcript_4501:106-759(-)
MGLNYSKLIEGVHGADLIEGLGVALSQVYVNVFRIEASIVKVRRRLFDRKSILKEGSLLNDEACKLVPLHLSISIDVDLTEKLNKVRSDLLLPGSLQCRRPRRRNGRRGNLRLLVLGFLREVHSLLVKLAQVNIGSLGINIVLRKMFPHDPSKGVNIHGTSRCGKLGLDALDLFGVHVHHHLEGGRLSYRLALGKCRPWCEHVFRGRVGRVGKQGGS